MYDAIIVGPDAQARRPRCCWLARATGCSSLIGPGSPATPSPLIRLGAARCGAGIGCPAINSMVFDLGPFALRGSPVPSNGVATAFAP
jgi:hypothetical protein